ncbi:MAG: hypothetical protein HOV80_07695, partial [Polyangiaceae bacterium]|nr:hypothetical protein [Polyangiaceae bacterium]
MGDIGVDHDVVELTLGGETLLLAESYEVASSILTPPAAFSLRLGSGEEVRALKERYPPGTPFQLAIDGVLQMSGTTDGYITEGSEGATEFTVRGRDALKPVHDKYVESALSFEDATYAELTQAVLDRTAPAPWALVHSNAANRKAITRAPASTTRLERIAQKLADGSGLIALEAGVSADALDELAAEDEATLAGGIDAATGAAMLGVGGAVAGPLQGALMVVTNPTANQRTLQAKVGDRWFEGFLKPELDRAGLMLWATADGDFV